MTMLLDPKPTVNFETVKAHVHEQLGRADTYDGKGVWIHRCSPAEIEAQLTRLSGMMAERRDLPLLGLTMAVKDNIDVAGLPTTAACPAFAYTPQVSAHVVQKLCDAGAIVVGKTNLDQFATGLVGTRSPHGACENFYDHKYISGGSSSGSATAVAAGLADFSLGTDTAGSGRVPAAFNNLFGLKPSLGLLSTAGVVPACRSLDCVSIFATNACTAKKVMKIAEGFDANDIYSRTRAEITTSNPQPLSADFRLGLPDADDLEFFGNTEYEALFIEACRRFDAIGAERTPIDFGPFNECASLLYEGPWVAERLAAISEFYDRHADQMQPATRQIIGAAENITGVDTFRGLYNLAALRRQAAGEWGRMDIMLLPTAGTIYTIDQVNADPIALNRNLGYYTNFVNLLDLCALAIPAGFTSAGMPFGITLIAPAGNEARLFVAAERFAGAQS
ncbi:MAG: allophanate hydrolase [Phycisphaerales bacterium]|nr:allophanate hydrolase [Phycisphaerales bacterium]